MMPTGGGLALTNEADLPHLRRRTRAQREP